MLLAQCQVIVSVAPLIAVPIGWPLKVLSNATSLPMVFRALLLAGGIVVLRAPVAPPPLHAVSPVACWDWRTAMRSAWRAALPTASR